MYVSIITPVYNSSATILNTYESIKNQRHTNWQWIIIDDKSTDNSHEICSEIAVNDPRVTLQKKQTVKRCWKRAEPWFAVCFVPNYYIY